MSVGLDVAPTLAELNKLFTSPMETETTSEDEDDDPGQMMLN